MDADQLVDVLAEGSGANRRSLYLNRDHIDEAFTLRVSVVNEILITKGVGGEVSGGFLNVIGGKLAKKRDVGAKVELTPLLRALLLEFEERESGRLVDLASSEPRGDAFLAYLGPGQIFASSTELAAALPDFDISEEAASAIQRIQTEHEKWYDEDPQARTIVFVGPGPRLVVAIASREWVSRSAVSRYHAQPPFGLLGRLQEERGEIVLVSPFWIWKEFSGASP